MVLIQFKAWQKTTNILDKRLIKTTQFIEALTKSNGKDLRG